LLLFFSAQAQWPALSIPNVQVTSSVSTGGDLKDYWACTDGVGGSFSVFSDDRQDPGGNESVYCQRIDKNGIVKFVANGVALGAICTADQDRPKCTDDGSSNAIACWQDSRSGGDDIYAQKIDSNGVVQWAINGVLICNATGTQDKVWIVSDGGGGAIIAWEDARSGAEDIYAQRVNSAGMVQWTVNGVLICNATGKQKDIHMVADGLGGAIITWRDERTGVDVYAQKVNSAGVVQWTANGVVISAATGDQKDPKVTTDGSNGGIITWSDMRGATEDIYAQRINATGVVQWAANGVAICTSADVQKRPELVSDQAGGAVIAWEDNRSGVEDIYAQRINATGVVQWAANGVVVSNAIGKQKRLSIAERNFGGTLIAWEDDRTAGIEDIYVQVVDANGIMLGTANGIAVCTANDKQTKPFIFRNAGTDWIVLWKDDRNSGAGQTDLYAQGLNPTIIPELPIELISFEAHANDGKVDLKWVTATEINNDFFTIEKTKNGSDFVEVAVVQGAGNSNGILEYLEVDWEPWEGVSYYRLKQTDFNGKYTYSGLVPVEYSPNGQPGMTIFPNPASSGQDVFMLLEGLKNKEILVVLRDIRGAEVYSKVMITETNNELTGLDPTGQLAPGTYLVTASSENVLYSRKLVVK